MKLSVSNIAWSAELDTKVWQILNELGYTGLEIAPTRIFPEAPYERLKEAEDFARTLRADYGLAICSMQSIWYGRTERLFGTEEERRILLDYTKKAVDFAKALHCPNLVFGSPKNRQMPEGASLEPALSFFGELAEYAASRGTVLSLEPNPPLYHTNFINTTAQACALVKEVRSHLTPAAAEGFAVNLDLGTILENRESLDAFPEWLPFVHHIHISEPGLARPGEEHLPLFRELAACVQEAWKTHSYDGFVSVEMGRLDSLPEIRRTLEMIREVFL